ncbi:peptidase C60, sortase A and B [Rubrobacter xylanophilus DSM 9941]|uniref:Peptidase C60, sortase A and B n=1 Tax=Rubrobacter xylanophilus (strain DSM 9941 / JCM 11954 / NBRC 16129 / PRD-1) TaxID=266117 RepID=Q1AT19_RUBXD|nr:sortase [Rubrobacter xylanophilus]ABG05459.1 peptidase C60, sortase A and B [Rubrobacter xylanophilus DSM 9941]
MRDDPLLRLGVALLAAALLVGAAAVAAALALRDAPAGGQAARGPGGEERPVVAARPEPEGTAPWVEGEAPGRGERDAAPPGAPGRARPGAPPSEGREPRRAQSLPVARAGWPMPTPGELEAASGPRRYRLPPGAILALTVEDIGLYRAPVWNTDARWALDSGVIHVPETSLPWSETPERNVYLAGHRLGYPGTGSRLIFYRLDELERGDRVLLEDRRGRRYEYRVTQKFVVGPRDSWVMGRVRGRDMVTLQTCTPIPAFDRRLIVRADRV